MRVLFNWESAMRVLNPKQKTVLFGEQRINVAYFAKVCEVGGHVESWKERCGEIL